MVFCVVCCLCFCYLVCVLMCMNMMSGIDVCLVMVIFFDGVVVCF